MSRKIPIAVIKAAEARALGNSWEAAATASGWRLEQLRHWTRKRLRTWNFALDLARREARDAACDEAVAMLRKQLRDEETKTKFDAANAVAKHFSKDKTKPGPAKPKETPAEFLEVLATIPEGTPTRVDLHLQAAEDETRATASAGDDGTD